MEERAHALRGGVVEELFIHLGKLLPRDDVVQILPRTVKLESSNA